MTNRIEDLIEKARHYQDLWHEALDENKRLRKAGDDVFCIACNAPSSEGRQKVLQAWQAAKEGENK